MNLKLQGLLSQKTAIILCGLLILAALFFLPSAELELQPLAGWFTVETDSEQAPLLSAALNQKGIRHHSPYNHFVEISHYDGYQRLAVSDLDRRLDHRDLRFDPYLKSLVNFYYRQDQEAKSTRFFLPADRSSLRLKSKFRRLGLEDVKWRLSGASFFKLFFLLSSCAALLFLLWFFFPRFRDMLNFLVPLLLVLIFSGAFIPIWFALLLWSGFLFFAIGEVPLLRKRLRLGQSDWCDGWRRPVLILCALSIPSLLLLGFSFRSSRSLWPMVLVLCYSLLSFYALFVRLKSREQGPGYTGMLVQPLLRSRSFERARMVQCSLLALMLLVLPLNMFWHLPESVASVQGSSNYRVKHKNIRLLASDSDPQMPDYMKWAAHRRFQQGFRFGGDWDDFYRSLYEGEAAAELSGYRESSGRKIDFFQPSGMRPMTSDDFRATVETGEKQFGLFKSRKFYQFTLTTNYEIKFIISLYRILIIVNSISMVLLFFLTVPLRFRRRNDIILFKELVNP